MKWTILNVSIPVHDLNKSKEFYRNACWVKIWMTKNYIRPLFNKEQSVFIGKMGFRFEVI